MNKRLFSAAAQTLILIVISVTALGHPGHSARRHDALTGGERVWISADGSLPVRGSFVTVKDGQVQIRRADDSLVNLNVSQLNESDRQFVERRRIAIQQANEFIRFTQAVHTANAQDFTDVDLFATQDLPRLLAQVDPVRPGRNAAKVPDIAAAFEAFVKTKAIRTRWDNQYFYVESKGIPDHRMMVGITAWQQQVPLPQSYFGENAWRIPLHPVPAQNPITTKNSFLRGAIALAVNGVPIFNPLNNRGDDSFLFGELDEFGGHCGRADDYHYHIAPIHLQKTIGKDLPIAYALDGYPIYGYDEPDGANVKGLDTLNGHKDSQGRYHYHATKTYPYLNGGFYGEVTERGGQVDPQPRAEPIRPDLRPLRDARITDFKETKPGTYDLTYTVNEKQGSVQYTMSENGSVSFTFVDTSGKTANETYSPTRRGPGDDRRPPPRRGDNPPPPRDGPPPRRGEDRPETTRRDDAFKPRNSPHLLTVTSSAIDDKGYIAAEFTCDGASASPPIEWKGGPKETRFYAISVWHTAPDQEKSYWVVYNIPARITQIDKNSRETGTVGTNDKRRAEYDPMYSKGSGAKKYHLTVYALSAEPKLPVGQATCANLLTAIQDITLAAGILDFLYERKRYAMWRRLEASSSLGAHQADPHILVMMTGRKLQFVGVYGKITTGIPQVQRLELIFGIMLPEIKISATTASRRTN